MHLPEQPTKLLTIITASNRPHNMRKFLENLKDTVDDYSRIEVLAKIDIGDTEMQEVMEEAVKIYDFEIRYLQTPRLDGYYTLHYGYQQLLEMSNPETYFIFPVNEEVRFKTKGWDTILAGYVGFFADDFFRLKISRLKYRNYYTIYDCGPTPENYPFVTRKWMELAGGIGDCWGPDGWHQYIDYHLGQTGVFRSVPIHDILISGEEAGKELTATQIRIRSHRIFQEWWRMYRTEAQQEFRRIATRMMAYVWAKNEKLEDFSVIEEVGNKRFRVKDNVSGEFVKDCHYHLSSAFIKMDIFYFLIKMARRNSIGFLTAFIYPSYGPKAGMKKYINRAARYILVLAAVFLSFVTAGSESLPKKHRLRLALRLKMIMSYFQKRSLEHERLEKISWHASSMVSFLPRSYSFLRRCMINLSKIVTAPVSYFKSICSKSIGPIRPFVGILVRGARYYTRKIIERIYYPNPIKKGD
jgi:hypothetical protein